jgi:hypothetical protein
MMRAPLAWALAASLLVLMVEPALAQPSDGHGTPKGTTGLGKSSPSTSDVSLDPAWRVYAFERDGVSYLQVNDLSGAVHAVVGLVGGVVWTLPLGSDVDRVSTPQQPLPVAPDATWSVVYRSAEVELKVYAEAGTPVWVVAIPSTNAP